MRWIIKKSGLLVRLKALPAQGRPVRVQNKWRMQGIRAQAGKGKDTPLALGSQMRKKAIGTLLGNGRQYRAREFRAECKKFRITPMFSKPRNMRGKEKIKSYHNAVPGDETLPQDRLGANIKREPKTRLWDKISLALLLW